MPCVHDSFSTSRTLLPVMRHSRRLSGDHDHRPRATNQDFFTPTTPTAHHLIRSKYDQSREKHEAISRRRLAIHPSECTSFLCSTGGQSVSARRFASVGLDGDVRGIATESSRVGVVGKVALLVDGVAGGHDRLLHAEPIRAAGRLGAIEIGLAARQEEGVVATARVTREATVLVAAVEVIDAMGAKRASAAAAARGRQAGLAAISFETGFIVQTVGLIVAHASADLHVADRGANLTGAENTIFVALAGRTLVVDDAAIAHQTKRTLGVTVVIGPKRRRIHAGRRDVVVPGAQVRATLLAAPIGRAVLPITISASAGASGAGAAANSTLRPLCSAVVTARARGVRSAVVDGAVVAISALGGDGRGMHPVLVLRPHQHDALLGALDWAAIIGYGIVLLGMGPDGHTASLFPNSRALSVTDRLVTLNDGPTVVPPDRVTMTYTLLNASRVIAPLVMGKEKAAMIDRVANGDDPSHDIPIKGIEPIGGILNWYLDEEACGQSADSEEK